MNKSVIRDELTVYELNMQAEEYMRSWLDHERQADIHRLLKRTMSFRLWRTRTRGRFFEAMDRLIKII